MSIDITMRRDADPESGQEYYEVQIGPNDHVCSARQRYWVSEDCDDDLAFWQALAFKNGAAAALETAAGLASRFLRNGKVKDLTNEDR